MLNIQSHSLVSVAINHLHMYHYPYHTLVRVIVRYYFVCQSITLEKHFN